MAHVYNADQHREYLALLDNGGAKWMTLFDGDTDFYSAAYWDLLTRMWKAGQPVRKTDALGFMTAVKSAQTAGKYVETALEKGLLVETDNPEDGRSRLITLSPHMQDKLDGFFDHCIAEMRRANKRVDVLGPSPSLD